MDKRLPILVDVRPRKRGDCEPCKVCQAHADAGELAADVERLACGHHIDDHANHCRPCAYVGCRHHALLEVASAKPQIVDGHKRDARPTTIRINVAEPAQIGRRAGLDAVASDAEVDAFADAALARLETMPHTCTLDVADAHPDGLQLTEVADLLGVTDEALRLEIDAARDGLDEFKDYAPADHTGNLARAMACGRVPRTKVGGEHAA